MYRDDLAAALARAEAAERALSGVCAVHTSTEATGECTACQRRLCDACVLATVDGLLCASCIAARKARRLRRGLVWLAVLTVVLGGGLAGFLSLGSRAAPAEERRPATPAAARPPQYSKRPYQILVLRQLLEKDPCNRDAAIQLADLLNANLAYVETIEEGRRFLERCGPFPELVHRSHWAQVQRGEWAAAAVLATTLIAEEPESPQRWLERGFDREKLGQAASAAADFRQAIAAGGTGDSIYLFAAVAEKLGRPCEGAFALRDKAARLGKWPDDDWERFKRTTAAGGCDAQAGTGKAIISFKPDVPLILAQVTVGQASGSFVVDPSAAQLTVTRAFAQAAGLTAPTADPAPASAYLLGEVRDVQLAVADRVALGGGAAPSVDVAIVDALPRGMDGVVGLSFLWRFGVTIDRTAGKLTLTGEMPPR